MDRKCPYCQSFNVRRSSAQEQGLSVLPLFRSPYHCRDCGGNFLVIARRMYVRLGMAFGIAAALLVLMALIVSFLILLAESTSPPPG